MGDGKKSSDKANSGARLLSGKNLFSIVEKVVHNRNKQLFVVILIIGILFMTIPEGVKNTSSENSGNSEEIRLSEILSCIDGCGNVSVMITYASPERYGDDASKAKGAVIVAEGAENAEICNKISEAAQAALDLPPHKVRVYKYKR